MTHSSVGSSGSPSRSREDNREPLRNAEIDAVVLDGHLPDFGGAKRLERTDCSTVPVAVIRRVNRW